MNISDIKIGQAYTFTRPTFLLKGVFVLQNSKIEVQEISDNIIKAQYIDREGMTHTLEDVKAEELID